MIVRYRCCFARLVLNGDSDINALLLIYSFHKLPNNKRHALNALDLLLCPDQLSL